MGHSHLEVRGQLRGLAFRGGESRRDCCRRDCCRDLSVSMLNTSGVTYCVTYCVTKCWDVVMLVLAWRCICIVGVLHVVLHSVCVT